MKKAIVTTVVVLLINNLFAANLFWVGGAGNWSDINHWVTSSGGSIKAGVVPSLNDDVYFDINSGFTGASKTVTVGTTGFCHNINVSGCAAAPQFSGSGSLNIYGSSLFQSGMLYSVLTSYLSSTASTLTSNGVKLNNSVTFNGSGSWVLQDSLSLLNITLGQGQFSTNNQAVDISGNLGTTGAGPFTLNLGSSRVYVGKDEGTLHFWSYSRAGSILNAGTSTIYVRHYSGASGISFTLTGKGGDNYYDIVQLTSGGPSSLILAGGTAGSPLNFHSVSFAGNGSLNGTNVFNTLVFSAGRTYTLQSSMVQTVNGSFSSFSPDCSDWILINSGSSGSQAILTVPLSGVITMSRNVVKDIQATGGGTFTTASSVDNGNNTGIVFTAAIGHSLYWVGGSGDYEDIAHWAPMSGGSGGYCVPGPGDDVYFDINSGFTGASKTVTVGTTGFCHNINVSGCAAAPQFSGSGSLNIYGSSLFQSGMLYSVLTSYLSSTASTLTSNGVKLNNSVTFNGSGSWVLQDSLSLLNITLGQGQFSTNNQAVDISGNLGTTGAGPFTLNLGSSRVYVGKDEGSPHFWYYSRAGSILNAGTSTIYVRHYSGASGISFTLTGKGGDNYYDIVQLTSGGPSSLILAGGTAGSPLNFHSVSFAGNGNLNGTNVFNTLVFSAGRTYTLQSSMVQTVNGSFSSFSPDCSDWILINSGSSGSQAILTVPLSGVITMSRNVVKDIQATGGGTFTTASSVDNGNNTGIVFTAAIGHSLYWVGGSGDYEDIAHWAPMSGGSGGYCVPGPGDDVYFDINSGFTGASKTVTVGTTGFCHNINVSGCAAAPQFSGSGSLNIYGSSLFQSGMLYSVLTSYLSSTASTLTSNGVKLNNSVTFNGSGSWVLQDSLSLLNITLGQGQFSTNNQAVDISGNLGTTGAGPFTLNLGSSRVYVGKDEGTLHFWSYSRAGSILNAGTSTIYVRHYSGASGISFTLTGKGGDNYYDIVQLTSGGPSSLILAGGTAGSPLNFHSVSFAGNGNLNGTNVFNTLVFSAGRTYTLQSSMVQTVNGSFYPGGNPCGRTIIKSSIAGTRSHICISTGSLTFNFAAIKDLNASCNALVFGDKSIDDGNNNNITFLPYNSGIITGLGPDASNQCSNYPVTLSTSAFSPAPSTTMLWQDGSNGYNFEAQNEGQYSVTVTYGDGCLIRDTIVLSTILQIPVLPEGNSIVSSGFCQANGYLRYNGTAASGTDNNVILAVHPNGNLCNPSGITVDNTGTLTGGAGTFSNSGTGYYESTDGINTLRITKRLHTVTAPGTYSVNGGVRVRVYYTDADTISMRTDVLPGNYSIISSGWFKCNAGSAAATVSGMSPGVLSGMSTLAPVNRGTDGGIRYVEFSVSSFSTFGYYVSTAAALPVKLQTFSGNVNSHCNANLEWQVSDAENFEKFDVESSADGIHYSVVGSVSYAWNVTNYKFTDTTINEASFYRLRMTDVDGLFSYSPVLRVYKGCILPGKFGARIYPNPVNGNNATIFISAAGYTKLSVQMFNANGQLISVNKEVVVMNNRGVELPTRGLAKGVYRVVLDNGNSGERIVLPLVVQ